MDKSQLDNMSNKVAAEFYERIGGEVPEAFKKQWKDKDKDNDGKENEPKPDFLKDKEKKSSVVPVGVVAALSADGEVEIFEASSLEDAKGLTAALQEKGGYSRIASGPNRDGLSSVELYDHFREFWAGCEKLPEGGMRDNCEKKTKEKSDEDKD